MLSTLFRFCTQCGLTLTLAGQMLSLLLQDPQTNTSLLALLAAELALLTVVLALA